MYLLRLDQGKKINNYQVLKRWTTKGILKTIRLKKSALFNGETENYKFYQNKIPFLTEISKNFISLVSLQFTFIIQSKFGRE